MFVGGEIAPFMRSVEITSSSSLLLTTSLRYVPIALEWLEPKENYWIVRSKHRVAVIICSGIRSDSERVRVVMVQSKR